MPKQCDGKFSLREGPALPRQHRFLRSEDGSLIIFGLFLFIMMLTAAGLGVDFMRFEAQRSRLQSTLDRAVLAAASLDQPLDPEDVVLDYFDKAGLSGYISSNDITVVDTLTSRRVTASASMDVGATLLQFAGIQTLTAPAAGAAEESASQTEISLVVDVSGSMGSRSSSGYSKIYELRQAAKDFVNIVLCDPSDPDETVNCTVEDGKVSVNVIPYSEQVLVGETLLQKFNVTEEHTSSSCVTFAADDFGTTAITATQLLQRTGHFDPWSRSSRTPRSWTCATNSWREILPVGSDAAVLRDYIDGLGASGNTAIDLGMKWGAALLDPTAQFVVDGLIADGTVDALYEDRPLDWDERGVEKVIVLMTDGVNTSQHYLYDGYRSGDSPIWRTNETINGDYYYSVYYEPSDEYYWVHDGSWHDHAYGTDTSGEEVCGWVYVRYNYYYGYWDWQCSAGGEMGNGATQMDYVSLWAEKTWAWYEQFSWLGDPGSSYGNSTKNTRLDEMCDAAKAEDITIFTIGFEVTSSSATVMRNCASSTAHYFDVDGLDLSDAFAAIAREISKLRLVN